MDVRTHDTVDAFLGAATAFLAADETRHNLAFGICSTLAETPDAYPSFRGWTAEDGAEVVGAALITPPFNLVVAQPRDDGALESLAHGLRRNAAELPGATGALPEVEQFAATWARLTRARARLHSRQGIYRVGSVREFPRVPGAMRSARPSERKLLDGGRSYCFLYTDLANPTANRIYQRIGYEFACESAEYAFASPGS